MDLHQDANGRRCIDDWMMTGAGMGDWERFGVRKVNQKSIEKTISYEDRFFFKVMYILMFVTFFGDFCWTYSKVRVILPLLIYIHSDFCVILRCLLVHSRHTDMHRPVSKGSIWVTLNSLLLLIDFRGLC